MHTVAQTILAQLGGNRFVAMTGARNFVGSADLLQFDLPRGPRGVTRVQIKLTGADLYAVAPYRWNARSLTLKPTEPAAYGVFVDQLREVFTAQTGLVTRL